MTLNQILEAEIKEVIKHNYWCDPDRCGNSGDGFKCNCNKEASIQEDTDSILALFQKVVDKALIEKQHSHLGFLEGRSLDEMYDLADKEDTKEIALVEGYNLANKNIRASLTDIISGKETI